MAYELCRHIKTNGRRCESPALHDESRCFFHHRVHRAHHINRAVRPVLKPDTPPNIALPALDDREAIQVALSVVVDAVANATLDPRRAGVLLRGLQIASKNAADIVTEPSFGRIAIAYTPTLDGFALAGRLMSDDSTPAPRPRKPLVDEAPPESSSQVETPSQVESSSEG